MKSILYLVVVVGICAVDFQGSQGAVVPYEGRDDFSVKEMDQSSIEKLAELINVLISNGMDSNGKDGRNGRSFFAPGVWCSLPKSLVDAFNPRTARVLGMSKCTPPVWKQTTTQATTAVTPCLVTSDMSGTCITEAPLP